MRATAKRSRQLFESGFMCAESVLKAIAEFEGIESELIPRISTGFCGGMSWTSGHCGAFTGGIMALNMLFGRDSADDSRDLIYELVNRYKDAFEESFGSTNCTELLECDLSTEAGREKFETENLIQKCYDITETATGILMRLLEEAAAVE